ncbi:sigma-70 family RNA polymerase sigma factor [bacterium]|nr:MAG: sigma-70 family RNA polymerase sigma factor [bacterium]
MGLNDNQLVKNYLEGNDEAFEELVKKYLKPIYNFLYRLTNNQVVAEDLAQDTFLKVWKNIRRFDQSRSFKTWIFTIAKNTAFDYFKKKKELPFSTFTDEEGESWLENIADENILPGEILERKNIAEELEEILKKLPVHYRTILLLHYKEDFSLHEIAEILSEPYNTVKSRHQRALSKLKKAILSDECV